MPTYDYQCTKCQYRFELRQSFSDEAVAACPSCDGKASRRISLVPVVFKGAGWYVNDYGKKGGGGGATASTPSDESESSKGASSKSKPDASTGSASSGKKSESTQTPSSSTPSKPQSKSSDK